MIRDRGSVGGWAAGFCAIVAALIGAYAALIASGQMDCPPKICHPTPTKSPVTGGISNGPPTVNVSPNSGGVNTKIEINVGGFDKNEIILFSLGGQQLPEQTTDEHGGYRLTIPLPGWAAKLLKSQALTLTVTGKRSGRSASTTFQFVK